jgi:iron(III) transport system substrate-binding protein
MKRFIRAALAAVAVAGVCAGSATSALAQSDFTRRPGVQALYEKARAEKEVVFWSPNERETQWVPAEFARRFPGIQVKTFADVQFPTRVITEARANRHSTDVMSHSLGGQMELKRRDLLAQLDWDTFGVSKGNVVLDGHAAATHNFIYTVIYDRTKVKPQDLPKRWADLTNPKWQGKLVSQAFLLPRLTAFLAMEWGPDAAEKWARTLVEQQKTLVINGLSERYLKTGERLLGVGENLAQIYELRKNGVDADFIVMDLIPSTQFIVTVAKNAPHPNAARLLAGWYASDEGKALAEKLNNESDMRPGSRSQLYKRAQEAKSKILLEDEKNMAQRAEYYKRYSGFIRGTQ